MTPAPVYIRGIAPNELRAATALCVRAKAIWGYDDAFLARCAAIFDFNQSGDELALVFVATRDNRLVGVGQILREDTNWYLDKLFVDPDNMGLGVGRALFDYATSKAIKLRAKTLLIESDPQAEGFYLRQGCARMGDVDSPIIAGRQLPLLAFDLTKSR